MHSTRGRSIQTCTRSVHAMNCLLHEIMGNVSCYADRQVAETLVFSRETSRRVPGTPRLKARVAVCTEVRAVYTQRHCTHTIKGRDVHEPATRPRFRSVGDTRGTVPRNHRNGAISVTNLVAENQMRLDRRLLPWSSWKTSTLAPFQFTFNRQFIFSYYFHSFARL